MQNEIKNVNLQYLLLPELLQKTHAKSKKQIIVNSFICGIFSMQNFSFEKRYLCTRNFQKIHTFATVYKREAVILKIPRDLKWWQRVYNYNSMKQ